MIEKKFFVVSWEFETSGIDMMCFTAAEIAKVIDDCVTKAKSEYDKGKLIITECLVSDDLIGKISKDEFISLYFDGIEEILEHVSEIGEITINL